MTKMWIENNFVPVTLVQLVPQEIVRYKTQEKDGYVSAVVGVEKKELKKEEIRKEKEAAPSPVQPPKSSTELRPDTAFPFIYYLRIVKSRIASAWPYSSGRQKAKCTVYFRIGRDGEISDVRIEQPSTDQAFDNSSVLAVLSAVPFPPLPDEYNEKYLGIYFDFENKVFN